MLSNFKWKGEYELYNIDLKIKTASIFLRRLAKRKLYRAITFLDVHIVIIDLKHNEWKECVRMNEWTSDPTNEPVFFVEILGLRNVEQYELIQRKNKWKQNHFSLNFGFFVLPLNVIHKHAVKL